MFLDDSNTLQHTGRKQESRWFIVMKLDDPNTLNTLIWMIHPDANTLGISMISLFASSRWFIFRLDDSSQWFIFCHHQLDACRLEFTRYPMLHRVLWGLRGHRTVCCILHVVCLVCWDGEGDKGRYVAAPAVYVFVHTYMQGAQMCMHTHLYMHCMCTLDRFNMCALSAHTLDVCTLDYCNTFALSAHILYLYVHVGAF